MKVSINAVEEEEEHVTSMEKMNRREKPQGET